MKATFILRDLTDQFYNGFGESIVGLLKMQDREKFDCLNSSRAHDLGIKVKIGNGSFRDRVDLNQLLRANPTVTFKLEPRKGYRLATFEFVK